MRNLCCALIIGFFVLLAIFADLISSWTHLNPNQQNILARYQPPLTHSEISADAKQTFIERWISLNLSQANTLAKLMADRKINSLPEDEILIDVGTKSRSEALEVLNKLNSPDETSDFRSLLAGFSSFHVLGTDEIGRDVFIRLVYGARISMGVGIMVAISAAFLGLIIGSLAGYYGGYIDTLLMRVTDSLLSLPMIPILIIISAIDLQKVPAFNFFLSQGNESVVKMVLILCLFSWMPVARLARGSILSLKSMDFILAAQTLGANDQTIILRHLLPNMMAPILVAVTLGVGESILYEAALSFLGLGIMPPTSSWGNMLTNAQEVIFKSAWLTFLPGLMIFLTTVSINFIGDGLQSALDPKVQRH